MKLIDEKIKELYGRRASFSEHLGIDPKNLSKKLKPIYNKLDDVTEFLNMLDLEVQIALKGKSAEAEKENKTKQDVD